MPTYSGNTQLVFNTYANVDTTLVINGPDGRWYCNDDFNGRDPQVLADAALSQDSMTSGWAFLVTAKFPMLS